MENRFGPGRCKCPDCEIFTDDFNRADGAVGGDWTTVAGTFSIDANELETTSDDGLIVSDTVVPDGREQQVITVDIKSDTDDDEIRVIIGYDDSNNYLYAQFKILADCGQLKFFQVSGGTHTQLGETFQLLDLPKDEWHTVRVCYREPDYPEPGKLTAIFDLLYYSVEVDITAGDQGGLGTGTIAGTVNYDNWRQDKYMDEDECPDCEPSDVVCGIYSEIFGGPDSTDVGCAWEEIAGDWEIESNELEIADASAILKTSMAHPLLLTASKIEATVKGDTTGDTARVIFDYEDDANYHYVEVTFGVTPNQGNFALYDMNGGTPNKLDDVDVDLALNTNHNIIACFHDDAFDADINPVMDDCARAISAVPAAHGGLYTGLGTGTTVTGTVNFLAFTWSRRKHEEDGACSTCPCTERKCPNCSGGPPAGFISSEYLAVVDGNFSSNDGTDCPPASETCDDLNGAYILQDAGIFLPCLRRTDMGVSPCAMCSEHRISVNFTTGGVLGPYAIDVRIADGVGTAKGQIIFELILDEPPDCTEIDGLEIPYKTTLGTCCKGQAGDKVILTAL